jgi:hypothetical protein
MRKIAYRLLKNAQKMAKKHDFWVQKMRKQQKSRFLTKNVKND